MRYDKGEQINDQDVFNALSASKLVLRLTIEFIKKPLYTIWRIIALSEIPYTNRLEYTQQVIEYINKYLTTPSGFSLTNKEDNILPCYNAMLAEAFSKLGYAQYAVNAFADEQLTRLV